MKTEKKSWQSSEHRNKEQELNEMKSRFVTIASHEFRTPLSAVLSSAHLLQKYTTTEDQPKRQKHIDRIIASVHLLTDILDDFLSVGKIEEGKVTVTPAPFQLPPLIESILSEFKNVAKEGQHIEYEHYGEEDAVLDASLLKHIVINLLSNAIKFSPTHSLITITTTCHDNGMVLSVKDRGIGISKEDQAHLFERFFRGANAANIQGTGLGLHIVARYAELMHGTVTCMSELGKGTEIVVALPFSD
jgi:signal transduction histidine kinase